MLAGSRSGPVRRSIAEDGPIGLDQSPRRGPACEKPPPPPSPRCRARRAGRIRREGPGPRCAASASRAGTNSTCSRSRRPPTARRDHRPAVRHRLARRRPRSPRGARARRRRPPARTTRRARRAARSRPPPGTRPRSGPSPTITRGEPPVASTNSRMPFSCSERPAKRTCGGSSGSRDAVRAAPTPNGTTRTSRAPSAARLVGEERRRGDHEPRARASSGRRAPARAARARRPCPTPGAT